MAKKSEALSALQSLNEAAKGGPGSLPKLADVAEAMIGKFGGPDQFASAFKAEMDKAKEGTAYRARLFGEMLKLFVTLHDRNIGADRDVDPSLLTDEDIEREALALMGGNGDDAESD